MNLVIVRDHRLRVEETSYLRTLTFSFYDADKRTLLNRYSSCLFSLKCVLCCFKLKDTDASIIAVRIDPR